MNIGLLLSKEHPDISLAEAEAILKLLKGKVISQDENFLKVQVSEPVQKEILNRAAYIKLAITIELEAKTPEDVEKLLLQGLLKPSKAEFDLERKNKFKITKLNLLHSQRDFADIKKIAGAIWNYKFTGSVDLENPDMDFHLVKAKKYYLGIKLWENTDKFMERRADKRPANHPTAMSPRLAKALVNLAGAEKEILDPFCGAGGILIEAGLMNLNTTGLDIDKGMIARAKQNLDYFKIKNYALYEQNALEWNKKAECIATDVPYGRSSKLKTGLSDLISAFLEKYESLTSIIVIAYPSTISLGKLITGKNWKIRKELSIKVHGTLTRKIAILEKK